MSGVLGEDQGLCGRSWVRIRAYVGNLARDQAGKWPKPEQEGRSGEGMALGIFGNPDRRTDFFYRYLLIYIYIYVYIYRSVRSVSVYISVRSVPRQSLVSRQSSQHCPS